ALAPEEPVHAGRGGVARLARVDHGDPPPGAGEREGTAQPGGAATDHQYVVRRVQILVHVPQRAPDPGRAARRVADMAKCWVWTMTNRHPARPTTTSQT